MLDFAFASVPYRVLVYQKISLKIVVDKRTAHCAIGYPRHNEQAPLRGPRP